MKQNLNNPKRRPLTAFSTQKPFNDNNISEYNTSRELIRNKHKPEILFEQLDFSEDNQIRKIIQRGPSLLGDKASTNTRPSSSYLNVKLEASSKIDSGKISKLIRRLSKVRLQTQMIKSMLEDDKTDEILKNMRSKNNFLKKHRCSFKPKPSVYKNIRRSSIDQFKNLMLQTQMTKAQSRPQLMVRSFFIS